MSARFRLALLATITIGCALGAACDAYVWPLFY